MNAPTSRRRGPIAAAAVSLLLVGGGAGASIYAAASNDGGAANEVAASATPIAQKTNSALSVNEIFRRDSPGVVEITVDEQSSADPYPYPGSGGQVQAQGSGFVYDAKGDIVTNEHVVDGASSIHVKFSSGATYTATLVGTDSSSDVAVLHVEAPASKLAALTLADSASVEVGEGVVAIGSPFGLSESVTSGIVSALHRQIAAPNNFPINDAIQTDAAINHGNSGGVLLDLEGRVIGVTAQIKSDSGGNDGVGFAIPSDTVKSVADGLIANGKVDHAYLGVSVDTVPAAAATQLGESPGVAVTRVRPGTPASKAGLVAATGSKSVGGTSYPTGGDVITGFDGTTVTSTSQLQALIAAKHSGDKVSLTLARGGDRRTLTLTLSSRPS